MRIPVPAILLCAVLFAASALPAAHAQNPAAAPKATNTFERTVRIVDENGKPLPNAAITLRRFNLDPKTAPITGKSNAAGEWKFSTRDDERSRLTATIAGRVEGVMWLWPRGKYSSPQAAQRNLLLTLLPIARLSVRLVDAGARPVPNATVRLLQRGGTSPSSGAEYGGDADAPAVKSDATGRIAIRFAAKGETISVRIAHEGFQTISAAIRNPEDEGLTLRLVPGGTLTGRLVNLAGEPLPGLKIRLPQFDSVAISDTQGRFTMDGLDEDTVFPTVEQADLCAALTPITTKRGQRIDIGDLKVTPGGLLHGTMAPGAALPERYANMMPVSIRSIPAPKTQPLRTSAFVGKDNRFEVRLAPGRYQLSAYLFSGPGRVSRVEQAVDIVEGQPTEVTLAPAPPAVPPLKVAEKTEETVAEEADKTPVGSMALAGRVLDESGKAAAGAAISITLPMGSVQMLKAGADGKFSIDAGPPVPGEFFQVSARQGDRVSESLRTTSGATFLTLRLAKESVFKVRAVDKDGRAIPGATVKPATFSFKQDGASTNVDQVYPDLVHEYAADSNPAEIRGLPTGIFLQVDLTAPGYALYRHVIALPRRGVVELPLSRETIIKGRLTAGRKPFAGKGLLMKAQTWNYSNYWWADSIKEDGTYEIRKVPSLEQLREGTLSLNIDMGESAQYGSKRRLSYIHGYDMLMTVQNAGKTEYWLATVEAFNHGLKYREGETVTLNWPLKPMAKLSGTVKGPRGTNVTVSYAASDSVYGGWNTRTDGRGHFTLYAEAGKNITLTWPGGKQDVKNLRSHETRTVELGTIAKIAGKTAPLRAGVGPFTVPHAVAARPGMPSIVTIRVTGPDGATIPRPDLAWQIVGKPHLHGGTVFTGHGAFTAPGMDGLVRFYLNRGDGSPMRISSKFMASPVTISSVKPNEIVTLRFNSVPPTPPAPQWDYPMYERSLMVSRASPARAHSARVPRTLQPGDVMPDWKFGATSRAATSGRVVLFVFGDRRYDGWLKATLQRWRGKPFTAIQILPPVTGTRKTSIVSDSGFTSIARDIPNKDGQNFRSLFQLGYSPSVLVGADGRLAAVGLSGPFLDAKIGQLLEDAKTTGAITR